MSPLVQAEGLALRGRLHETALSLSAGHLTCLVGLNGSGKTSLLHALAGIGAPQGEVWIDGTAARSTGPARRIRLIGFLPASRELRWPLPARDLILLGGATSEEAAEVETLLELNPVADRRLDHLSTGERSRVLIARALAPRPRLLLLDEPTANLDPLWQIRLMELLKEGVAARGQAALVAIHDLDAAARYADRLLVMSDGRIAADGPPAEIIDGPVVPAVFGIRRVSGGWRPAA